MPPCVNWDNHVVFVFGSVYVVNYIIDLLMLNQPCIPGMNPTWSWWISFWFAVAISLPIFYWRFLHLCSSWILAWSFLFLLGLCWVLVSGWCLSHKMIWEGFPLFGLFGIVSEGMVPASPCVSGRIRLWTHPDGFFLVGRLLIATSTSTLVILLFRASTSS